MGPSSDRVGFEGLPADQLAAKYGLQQMGIRPPLGPYLRSVWERRSFVMVLAQAKAQAENQSTYLGQFWTVLNPIMNALVYVLVFGILLGTSRGLINFIGFIVVGTFMYQFFSKSVSDAAKSIPGNRNLVRSLHFPRAVLPISAVLTQLTTLLPALAVMALFTWLSDRFMVGSNVTPNWRWLLIIPATLLLYIFSTGVGFIFARVCARFPDLLNLLPFFLRILMYGSGVLFGIDHYIKNNDGLVALMSYQPIAIYLDIARQAMLKEPSIPLDLEKWLWGIGWAVLFIVIGIIIFWRDEARYGRD